jgi:hypothetical protein
MPQFLQYVFNFEAILQESEIFAHRICTRLHHESQVKNHPDVEAFSEKLQD